MASKARSDYHDVRFLDEFTDDDEVEEVLDTETDEENVSTFSKDFSPMDIDTDVDADNSSFAFNCKKAVLILCVVGIVGSFLAFMANELETSSARARPAPVNHTSVIQDITGRGLTCHPASAISGGTTGGHCQGVFVKFMITVFTQC